MSEGVVDQLVDSSALRRVLGQIDVSFSNSPIEAWWRILKHQWLYLHGVRREGGHKPGGQVPRLKRRLACGPRGSGTLYGRSPRWVLRRRDQPLTR